RSAGRRIPRALCRLLRSGVWLCRLRRTRLARRAGSALARSAVHPRARPDRRPPGLREDAGTAGPALRLWHRLELPGAGPQTVEALSRLSGVPRSLTSAYARAAASATAKTAVQTMRAP